VCKEDARSNLAARRHLNAEQHNVKVTSVRLN
jgi:hypothetical protein